MKRPITIETVPIKKAKDQWVRNGKDEDIIFTNNQASIFQPNESKGYVWSIKMSNQKDINISLVNSKRVYNRIL